MFGIAGLTAINGRGAIKRFLSPAMFVTLLGLATLWSWLVFHHVLEAATGSAAEVATTLAYPILDLILISVALISMAEMMIWKLYPRYLALLAGLILLPVADSIYASQVAQGTYASWMLLDTLWPASAVLIAAGAWLQIEGGRGRGAEIDPRRLSFVLSASAIGITITILFVDHFSRVDDLTMGLAGAALVAGLADLIFLDRARDRAERRALAAAAENEGLAQIVRSSQDAILSADLTGVVTEWNEGAERLYGFSRQEARGRLIYDLMVPLDRTAEVDEMLESAAAGESSAFETRRLRRSGSTVEVSLRAFPLHSASGAVSGISVSAHDITDQRAREGRNRLDQEGRLWRQRIKTAFATDTFAFWGQPLIDLASGEVDHNELLLRMMLDGEPVTPDKFIPHAEASDLIHEIDHWAVRAGIEYARHLPVAINLSAKGLGDHRLIELISEGLRASSVDPSSLTFELTETAASENFDAAQNMVCELRALGCRVALDDFGTGFNSFTHLKHLPVTSLKIDIQFIRNLTDHPANERIVNSIVSIARNFGMTTVAEGVEDEQTLDRLRVLGVDCAQGYYIGRPSPMSATPGRPRLVPAGLSS